MKTVHLTSPRKFRVAGIALATLLATASIAVADTITQFSFTSGALTPDAGTTLANTQTATLGGAGITATKIQASSSSSTLFFSSGTGNGIATTEAQAFGTKISYIDLTLAPSASFALTVSSLQFNFGAVTSIGGTASVLTPSTVMIAVRYSTDNGSTWSSTFDTEGTAITNTTAITTQVYQNATTTVNSDGSSGAFINAAFGAQPRYSVDLSSVSGQLTSVTGSVIFRIAAWYDNPSKFTGTNTTSTGADPTPSTTESIRIDNLLVTGSVSAIPEPSTYAALASLGVLGFAACRRFSRRK